jgi:hypothetical protein
LFQWEIEEEKKSKFDPPEVSPQYFPILTLGIPMCRRPDLDAALRSYLSPVSYPDFTSTVSIRKLPLVLLFSISRQSFSPTTSTMIKDCTPFYFPIELDMQGYVPDSTRPIIYQLAAVVAHRGDNKHVGHYLTFCRIWGQWFEFNDDSHRRVSNIQAIDDNVPTRNRSNQTAAMLVYIASE